MFMLIWFIVGLTSFELVVLFIAGTSHIRLKMGFEWELFGYVLLVGQVLAVIYLLLIALTLGSLAFFLLAAALVSISEKLLVFSFLPGVQNLHNHLSDHKEKWGGVVEKGYSGLRTIFEPS